MRRSLRHRAKLELGLRSVDEAQIGAITFVQRGDSSLRLNVHFHSLALDGVYVRDDAGVLQFHALSTPTPEQVAEVARWTYEGLAGVCERHGRSFDELDDDADTDELAHDQPALAACYGASVRDRQLLGAAPGQRTRKLVHPVCEVPAPGESIAEVGGVNVHAGPAIDGRDRRRLERLCRYVARPPVAQPGTRQVAQGAGAGDRGWDRVTRAADVEQLASLPREIAPTPVLRCGPELAARTARVSDKMSAVPIADALARR